MEKGGRFDIDGKLRRTNSAFSLPAKRWSQMSEQPKSSGTEKPKNEIRQAH